MPEYKCRPCGSTWITENMEPVCLKCYAASEEAKKEAEGQLVTWENDHLKCADLEAKLIEATTNINQIGRKLVVAQEIAKAAEQKAAAHAKQSAHFESLYLMECDKTEAIAALGKKSPQ